jgi:hypothetical protein
MSELAPLSTGTERVEVDAQELRIMGSKSTLVAASSAKTAAFWRAQFCTEVAHPTRFERVTFAFGELRTSLIALRRMRFSSIDDAILLIFAQVARTFRGHHLRLGGALKEFRIVVTANALKRVSTHAEEAGGFPDGYRSLH